MTKILYFCFVQQNNFDFTIHFILDILSISTSFMLGLLFITSKSKNRKANIFLGLFLFSLSIEILGSFLNSFIDIDEDFALIQTTLFIVPFLFLYVYQTLNVKIYWFYFLLFLPGAFANFLELENLLLSDVFNICILLYLLKTLKNHHISLGNFYSDIENKTFTWIKTIIYIYLFFYSIWIIEEFLPENWQLYFVVISNVLTFFMIYWIGYNGFSQSEIFTSLQFQTKENSLTKVKTESISETKQKFVEMNKIILETKLFTDINLTLKTLSIQLEMKEKEVSKLINLHTSANFFHFINQFRIDEFKKLLSSPVAKKLSLLGLALESGFASKSTFYAVFKNAEGITPKQYQNQLKQKDNL